MDTNCSYHTKHNKSSGKENLRKIEEGGNQCSGALVVDKKVSLGHKSDIAILCSESDKSQQFKQFNIKQSKNDTAILCAKYEWWMVASLWRARYLSEIQIQIFVFSSNPRIGSWLVASLWRASANGVKLQLRSEL